MGPRPHRRASSARRLPGAGRAPGPSPQPRLPEATEPAGDRPEGEASVRLEGGPSLSTPRSVWSATRAAWGGATRAGTCEREELKASCTSPDYQPLSNGRSPHQELAQQPGTPTQPSGTWIECVCLCWGLGEEAVPECDSPSQDNVTLPSLKLNLVGTFLPPRLQNGKD